MARIVLFENYHMFTYSRLSAIRKGAVVYCAHDGIV